MSVIITETANPNSKNMDEMSVRELLELINTEDHLVPVAVRRIIPQIEKVVDFIVDNFPRGGRIIYVGAGSSGRIAAMDAAECPPTFGINREQITVLLAGGKEIFMKADEGREDEADEGSRAISALNPNSTDCVIGLAASGRTPFVLESLKLAAKEGAFTALICSSMPETKLISTVRVVINVNTGPEVLTGSTRMKATTAMKLVTNMISTTAMVKLGRTIKNHMCYIKCTNKKLKLRAIYTIIKCCGVMKDEATQLLEQYGNDLPVAIVSKLTNSTPEISAEAIKKESGNIKAAIKRLLTSKEGG